MTNFIKLFAFIIIANLTFLAHAEAPDWGRADTLACHNIGPGIEFTSIYYRDRPMKLWMLTIDMTNQYNKVEQVQSRHQVPDVSRWTVQKHSTENTYPGHRVAAAINHDFFSYDMGICIGPNISNGQICYGAGSGRSMLAINDKKEMSVFYPQFDIKVVFADESTLGIDFYNSAATGLVGDCILFNTMNSLNLEADGNYIRFRNITPWVVNGDDIECEVLEISSSPLQTSDTDCVLFLRGSKLNAANGKVEVGGKLKISQKLNSNPKYGTPINNILNAFHGYPNIAFNGVLHDGEYNNFENGREYEISCRTMAGVSKDGTKLYIVATELSGTSVGVNCIDIANWMLAHGSWHVENYDSGGSTAIVVDHVMLNEPGRGSLRPVEDALLAVSTAPESSEIDSYTFIAPSIYPSAVSLVPLTILALNPYSEVLDHNATGFTYECVPNDLGYIDENNVFHSGTKEVNGKIIATKDGKQATLAVYVRGVQNIKAQPEQVLLSNRRQYAIQIEGTVDTETYTLDPSAFQWTSSNPECCTVTNGIAQGVSNGTTILTGTLDDLTLTVNVTVEASETTRQQHNFANLADWTITKSSAIKNMTIDNTTTNLPSGWSEGANVNFNLASGRALYIEPKCSIKFYSLPDSASFRMNVNNSCIEKVLVQLSSATTENYKQITLSAKPGDNVYSIPFTDDNGDIFPITEYPISLSKFKIYTTTGLVSDGCQFSLTDLRAYYPGYTPSGSAAPLIHTDAPDNAPWLSTTALSATIHFTTAHSAIAHITICDTTGKATHSYTSPQLAPGTHTHTISFSNLAPGIYLAQVVINGHTHALKFSVSH